MGLAVDLDSLQIGRAGGSLVEEYAHHAASCRPTTGKGCAVPEFDDPSATGPSHDTSEPVETPVAEIGPTINARLEDGPLAGNSIEAGVVEGRPPKTIDVPAEDGSTCRYCLAGWVQSGRSAVYTFLYRV